MQGVASSVGEHAIEEGATAPLAGLPDPAAEPVTPEVKATSKAQRG